MCPAKDEVCKHCGKEIYFVTGWVRGTGVWRHYHNDKEHCSWPISEWAEPSDKDESNHVRQALP